jgi:ergothioneine biosynthesis protein EgtB
VTEELINRLDAAWARSDALFGMLRPEALFAQPIALRQPFVFYLGHLPAFAWNQVGRGVFGREAFEPELDVLFARGIDPTEVDEYAAPRPESWPSLPRILEYRDRVREAVRAIARGANGSDGQGHPLREKGRIFRLALEHELMHQETFLYMLQQLPAGLKRRPPDVPRPSVGRGAEAGAVEIPAGRVSLGADLDALPFGWDNEFGHLEVDVPAFRMDTLPVRNHEFLEFVEDGGYQRSGLWTPEGWAWRTRREVRHPAFWQKRADGWWYGDLFEDFPLDEVRDWPVYVSWAEARAFTRWRKARLATEAEFCRAAYGTPAGELREHPWGGDVPDPEHGNFDLRHWSPEPVGRRPSGASAWGVQELVGNGWEWTETRFAGFPGFTPYIRTYPTYSEEFFDGRHYVLRGASWATDALLVRPTFRNWFQPHYPYVYAKLRCVRPLDNGGAAPVNV